MKKQDILSRLSDSEYIYGYMYGNPFLDIVTYDGTHITKKDSIIQIKTDALRVRLDGLLYSWGWPGPDYNFYRYKDYGKTWAFSKEEIE